MIEGFTHEDEVQFLMANGYSREGAEEHLANPGGCGTHGGPGGPAPEAEVRRPDPEK